MVTMLSTFPCCPPRVGNNQAGPPALSVRKAFPEAITTLPSNVVREHGECPHSSFSFHVIYLHNILGGRRGIRSSTQNAYVFLPPGLRGSSSGRQPWMGDPRTQTGTTRGTQCASGSLEHIKSAVIVRVGPNTS